MNKDFLTSLEIAFELLFCASKDNSASLQEAFDRWFLGIYQTLPETQLKNLRTLRQKVFVHIQ